MALSDIVSRTRTVLYGKALGEKPAIRIGAANANESTSGQLVTFSVLAGEGAKIKPGNVLAVHDPATREDAHVIYVTSVATDAVTGVNGYLGSPAVAGSDSGDLDAAIFEQNPNWTNFEIFEAIDTIVANMLWPEVFDMVTATIATPNLQNGQEAIPAEVEEIISAWQIIGPDKLILPVSRQPWEVHTDVASTGKLASFSWFNGSAGYYTYRAKYATADEADTELTYLISIGAAALLMGAAISETSLEATKKDNSEAANRRQSVASTLWRDFLTLKANMSGEQSKRLPQQIMINRG